MYPYLAVACGGALGATLRFAIATACLRLYQGLFPLGTFLINVTGSFAIGILMPYLVTRPAIHPAWRLFLVVGVLGGYTTFSSFEWETFAAFKAAALATAALNVILSVALGFLGVWAGAALVARFTRP